MPASHFCSFCFSVLSELLRCRILTFIFLFSFLKWFHIESWEKNQQLIYWKFLTFKWKRRTKNENVFPMYLSSLQRNNRGKTHLLGCSSTIISIIHCRLGLFILFIALHVMTHTQRHCLRLNHIHSVRFLHEI